MSRSRAHEAGSGPALLGGRDVAGLVARLAAIRPEVDRDPLALVELLRDLGADLRDAQLDRHLPAALALLDEFETLVELLAERGRAVAAELGAQGRRRRALGAYRPPAVRP